MIYLTYLVVNTIPDIICASSVATTLYPRLNVESFQLKPISMIFLPSLLVPSEKKPKCSDCVNFSATCCFERAKASSAMF